MLFPAVVVMAALAGPAVAEPPMRFSRMATRDLFGLARRGDDDAYAPSTSFCGVGRTCAEACGAGYDVCGKVPKQTRCYNPAAGESCCAEGLSCDKGFSCSAKGDMCLPAEAVSAPSAQYAAVAMTTSSESVAPSTASSVEPVTTLVLSSSSPATTSSTSSDFAVLSVASSSSAGSASLNSHASTEECTQTTAIVVVPTPVASNTTTTAAVQNGPTESSASQTIQATITPSSFSSHPAPAPSNTTATTSGPSVVPANAANGHQGPALMAVLLGAVVVVPVLGL